MKIFVATPASSSHPVLRGFTIVELTVSIAVLSLLMVMVLSTVDQTQKIWARNTSKISQFQAARTAFEALTRNLSQATLNTYYGVEFKQRPAPSIERDPVLFYRASDLHFVSGKTAQTKLLAGDEGTYPTHGVFFQAPLGLTSETETSGSQDVLKHRGLGSLLSVVGYYLKWGEDAEVPEPIREKIAKRQRVRLMEVLQPSEYMTVYNQKKLLSAEAAAASSKKYAPGFDKYEYDSPTDWVRVAVGQMSLPRGLSGKQDSSRTLAENVVALIFLPKLAEQDRGTNKTRLDLATDYEYDSRPQVGGVEIHQTAMKGASGEQRRHFNQLPPIMQVIMVAVDETSAARFADVSKDAPTWTNGLFKDVHQESDVLDDLGDPQKPDPESLIGRLLNVRGEPGAVKMNYRLYSSDVVLRGAKWSVKD